MTSRWRFVKPLSPAPKHSRWGVQWMCPSCGWRGVVRTKPGKNHRAYLPGIGSQLRGQYNRRSLPRPIRVYWPLSPGWRGDLPWRACNHPWHDRHKHIKRAGYGSPAETTTTINLRVDTTDRQRRRARRHRNHQSKARR